MPENELEFDIQEELKKLPGSPGVYLMHGAYDEIIYVGKAVSLKNRVRQYFQSSRNKSPKILRMVSQIKRFEYIVTDSEAEALVLECNLIKEHSPRYNTMLKDDKAYPYIRVTVDEAFPRVQFSHQMRRDHARYFGPYTSSGAVKDTLDLIHRLFKIRTCSRVLPRDIGKERACLNYHIGQCSAPCEGRISQEEYRKQVDQVIDFLSGRYDGIQKDLKARMKAASDALEFEEAMKYRDLLASVKHVAEKQKITDTGHTDDRDIIAYAAEGSEGVMQVFFIREGRMIGRDHFGIAAAEDDDPSAVITSFVKQYYAGTPYVPKELWLQAPLEEEEADAIVGWLSDRRGSKVTVLVPERGEKSRLVDLAAKNAKEVLEKDAERLKRQEERTYGAMQEVASWIGLPEVHRVEAYDISHISGTESVGSMVVFEDGKPKKSDYRKFRLRYVQGNNDYASLTEVLTRRFEHGLAEDKQKRDDSFTRFPDLIMMDGGRGQVNVALEVLGKLGIDIPVTGMVKDDRHRTRGLYYRNREIPIDVHSDGFHLITRVQDEAHRFAIEFHRSLRSKASVKSVLDEIPGVGPKRRLALMRAFGDIEAIKAADTDALAAVPGMNRASAETVYAYFRRQDLMEKPAQIEEF